MRMKLKQFTIMSYSQRWSSHYFAFNRNLNFLTKAKLSVSFGVFKRFETHKKILFVDFNCWFDLNNNIIDQFAGKPENKQVKKLTQSFKFIQLRSKTFVLS